MTIHVFKTSVQNRTQVKSLSPVLNTLLSASSKWNFDLDDRDKILRVDCQKLNTVKLKNALKQNGFYCEELL